MTCVVGLVFLAGWWVGTHEPAPVAAAGGPPDFASVIPLQGTSLLGSPVFLSAFTFAFVPASGETTANLPIRDLGPGVDALDVHVQTMFLDDGVVPLYGPARVLTLLDASL